MTLTLSGDADAGDTITVSYTMPGSNPLQDADGKRSSSFSGESVTNNVSAFCAEYQAVYDSFTTKPSDAEAAIWNTFVESIVASGEWAMLDVFYNYAVHTNGDGEALKNWKNPGTFNPTLVNAPDFGINEGFTGNGSDNYIDCNWVPSTDGVNYVRNSASQIIYIRTDLAPGTTDVHGVHGAADNKNCMIVPRHWDDKAYIRINDATGISGANTNGSGMYINTRTAAAVNKLYKNKAVLINGTTNSIGVPTNNPYCLAGNDDNVAVAFRADQVSMYAFGGGFTQTNVNNLTDAFETAMDALGTGIIP
ncbi:hypothetical protein ES705_33014 [subsurface metagenome]